MERRQLQEIIAGLSDGIIILDVEGNIVWANDAALAAYDVETMAELGVDEAAFFKKFDLHFRNHHELAAKDFPMARLLAGEDFADVTVEV